MPDPRLDGMNAVQIIAYGKKHRRGRERILEDLSERGYACNMCLRLLGPLGRCQFPTHEPANRSIRERLYHV